MTTGRAVRPHSSRGSSRLRYLLTSRSLFMLPQRATRRTSRRGAIQIPLSRSRREAIRTNLWAVPTGMVVLIVGLFAVTYSIDRYVAAGELQLSGWLTSGGTISGWRSAHALHQTSIELIRTISLAGCQLRHSVQRRGPSLPSAGRTVCEGGATSCMPIICGTPVPATGGGPTSAGDPSE